MELLYITSCHRLLQLLFAAHLWVPYNVSRNAMVAYQIEQRMLEQAKKRHHRSRVDPTATVRHSINDMAEFLRLNITSSASGSDAPSLPCHHIRKSKHDQRKGDPKYLPLSDCRFSSFLLIALTVQISVKMVIDPSSPGSLWPRSHVSHHKKPIREAE